MCNLEEGGKRGEFNNMREIKAAGRGKLKYSSPGFQDERTVKGEKKGGRISRGRGYQKKALVLRKTFLVELGDGMLTKKKGGKGGGKIESQSGWSSFPKQKGGPPLGTDRQTEVWQKKKGLKEEKEKKEMGQTMEGGKKTDGVKSGRQGKQKRRRGRGSKRRTREKKSWKKARIQIQIKSVLWMSQWGKGRTWREKNKCRGGKPSIQEERDRTVGGLPWR